MKLAVAIGLALACASPALAQAPEQHRHHFVYTCTLRDGVTLAPDGTLARNEDVQTFIRQQSPITFDTETGRFTRAAGARAGLSETMRIVTHGGSIDSLSAYDTTVVLGSVLQIRTDLPADRPGAYRFLLHGSGGTFSGTCERAPK